MLMSKMLNPLFLLLPQFILICRRQSHKCIYGKQVKSASMAAIPTVSAVEGKQMFGMSRMLNLERQLYGCTRFIEEDVAF